MSGSSEDALQAAIGIVMAGRNLIVEGPERMGKSALLQDLANFLLDLGWTVTRISGSRHLKDHQLAALQVLPNQQVRSVQGQMGIHQAAEALRHTFSGVKSVLLVDDSEYLDAQSCGVIELVVAQMKVVVVAAHSRSPLLAAGGGLVQSSLLRSASTLHLDALSLEPFRRALEAKFDRRIESRTIGRAYSKSGGVIGLGVAMLEAAAEEGRFLELPNGSWACHGSLYSAHLAALLQTYVGTLPDEAYDAVEITAVARSIELVHLRKVAPASVIELLERMRLLVAVPGSSGPLLAVSPPLLAEHLRKELPPIRGSRLQTILSGLGNNSRRDLWEGQQEVPVRRGYEENDALMAATVRDRVRDQLDVGASGWRDNPNPENALRLLRVLLLMPGEERDATLESVFDDTDISSLGDSSRAEFIGVRAQWKAYIRGDLAVALDELNAELRRDADHALLYRAVANALAIYLDSVPTERPHHRELRDSTPDALKIVVFESELLESVAQAKVLAAQQAFESVAHLDPVGEHWQARVLHALTLLLGGQVAQAQEILSAGYNQALSALEIESLRSYGAALAVSHLHTGDYSSIDSVLRTSMLFGEPVAFAPATQLALLTAASTVACRRGDREAVDRYEAEGRSLNVPDGPLIGQSKAWLEANPLIVRGDVERASSRLWEAGDALWERGLKANAAHLMLVAVELGRSQLHLRDLEIRMRDLPEAASLQAQMSYVRALFDQSPEKLEEAAKQLEVVGRIELSFSALEIAESRFRAESAVEAAERCSEAGKRLRSKLGAGIIETRRFSRGPSSLTRRESEVSDMAARGLSNQEIADVLVVSVRTVESHMSRVMKKLGVSTRAELGDHLN